VADTENANEDGVTEDLEDESDDSQDDDNDVFDAERAKAKINKVNREAKNLRERLKAFEEAEAKRKESEMSETEKAVARAEAAEKRATELEFEKLRSDIARDKGLTAAQAKRLQGSTKEELEADAEDLLEAFNKPTGNSNSRGSGKLRGGANPDESALELDPEKLANSIRPR
jgi:DNA repair exonuclease SbcCD ATPase subunit